MYEIYSLGLLEILRICFDLCIGQTVEPMGTNKDLLICCFTSTDTCLIIRDEHPSVSTIINITALTC